MISMNTVGEWDVYLLAGVGSTPSLFLDCKSELGLRFRAAGREPVIRELFPYGYHTRKLSRQVFEVYSDVSRLWRKWRSGGRAAADQVRKLSAGRPVLFIGHSGGGVAAYQAAAMLIREGAIPDCRVVMVGSPKLPIHADFRDKVSYFQAVDERGKRKDPITRLGSWGGLSRGRFGLIYWNKYKHAPGHIGTITLLGGHPHYFRGKAPYVHPDRGSNLSLTIDSIWKTVGGSRKLSPG